MRLVTRLEAIKEKPKQKIIQKKSSMRLNYPLLSKEDDTR
jgi:hypothetical protein